MMNSRRLTTLYIKDEAGWRSEVLQAKMMLSAMELPLHVRGSFVDVASRMETVSGYSAKIYALYESHNESMLGTSLNKQVVNRRLKID